MWRAGLAALVLSLVAGPASAQGDPAGGGFEGYLQYLAAKARAEGVRETTILSVMAGLVPAIHVVRSLAAKSNGLRRLVRRLVDGRDKPVRDGGDSQLFRRARVGGL